MENWEKVEKIKEKTGVSYEEAKNALEQCNYDMLDALIMLEKAGKIKEKSVNSYTTSNNEDENSKAFDEAQASYEKSCQKSRFGKTLERFGRRCKEVLDYCWKNSFVVKRKDEQLLEIPVLVLIILLICLFWITIILLVVGLFLDCRYSFRGVDKMTVDINNMCDKASEVCNNIKEEFSEDK